VERIKAIQAINTHYNFNFMITTIGVFTTHAAAESALNELRQFGVKEADLSYVYINDKGTVKDGQTGSKVGGSAATGATAGAVIGGLAGLVVANGILPGLGSLIVAGPLATALGLSGATATTVAGAATGAVAGGLIGALTHLGVDKQDVQLYEDHVRRGDVLVIARSTPASTEDIFLNHGAIDVRHYNMR
jgi:hypothetical protein